MSSVDELTKEYLDKKDVIYKLAEIADDLDRSGKHEAADLIDKAMMKIARSNRLMS